MTINSPEIRKACAKQLLDKVAQAGKMSAFVGLDGFIDEIIHVVDKREGPTKYSRIPSIAKLAERIGAASGKSTNIELVNQHTKLGGNGPIMANALSSFGIKVTYLGALGYPTMHPVFDEFAKRAEVTTIAEAGHTDALEFDDGKIMFPKTVQLNDVTWANIQSRYGREKFETKFNGCDLIGFVNWTMIPYMSDLWKSLLSELCPKLKGPRRKVFFDLADPEKRPLSDLREAMDLIVKFQQYFDVILGLNEKESFEIGEALDIHMNDHSAEGLAKLAQAILAKMPINTVVIHPVAFALAASAGEVVAVQGPFCAKPLISTGAGDHFNSGFCLGKLLGLNNTECLLAGVSTSGYYVRTGHSPSIPDLAGLLQNWPQA
jgi:sugar/nucleoside kinase (ribokinase family)